MYDPGRTTSVRPLTASSRARRDPFFDTMTHDDEEDDDDDDEAGQDFFFGRLRGRPPGPV